MNFDFSEDQHEIKRTARDLLGVALDARQGPRGGRGQGL